MSPPYPYFFDVQEFPDVRMVGSHAGAADAQYAPPSSTLLRMAHERGISSQGGNLGSHLSRRRADAAASPARREGTKRRAGTGLGPRRRTTWRPITKAALEAVLRDLPRDRRETQFRMHDESGLKASEIEPFWHDGLRLLQADAPDICRSSCAPKDCPMKSVSTTRRRRGSTQRSGTKYLDGADGLAVPSDAHQHGGSANRRHSYADLLDIRSATAWTGSCGTAARAFAALGRSGLRAPLRRQRADVRWRQCFEVNEMQATKMLGEPHDAPPAGFSRRASTVTTTTSSSATGTSTAYGDA